MTLFIGGAIYLLFRKKSLLMFKWFYMTSLDISLEDIRNLFKNIKSFLPEWVLFSLPDGLWIFSYVSGSMLLWDNTLKRSNIFWVFLIPMLGLCSELGQINHLVPGTFDIIDFIFYTLCTILPIVIFKPKIILNE